MGTVEQLEPTHDHNGWPILRVEANAYCSRCAELEKAQKEITRLKQEVARLQRNQFIRTR